jgi:cell division protein FtsI (penicillin-binding protein 3)
VVALLQRRLGLLSLLFFSLLIFAGLRVLYLGAVRGPALSHDAASQQLRTETVPALRGAITDRTGVDLAVSEPADDLSADPELLKNPAYQARRIAPVLGVPVSLLLPKLSDRSRGFVYLGRAVPDATAQAVLKLNVPGVTAVPTSRRVYPRGSLAAQVLGIVGTSGSGLTGLEYSENSLLAGHDGVRRIVNDGVGQPLSITDVVGARPGANVKLTLDAAIQNRVEQVLAAVDQVYHPLDATAIVMDPRTGSLLAMANSPQVDANHPPTTQAGFANEENRAVGFDYEPGSTFKVVTVAGALSQGLVTPSTSFYLNPSIQVADRTIHDAENRGPVDYTTAQILSKSSNVGAVTIGLKLGPVDFDHWVRTFGFGKPTGVDLPGESPITGLVKHPSQYSGSSMGNLPIGQGEEVTPLQMANAYAAIANGGILRPPHIVAAIGGKPAPQPKGRRILSPTVAAQLRSMLEGVLQEGGTASEVSIPGYTLAGKTGTANKVDPATGQYSNVNYIASFVGFAPASDPQLLCAVIVDQPQGSIYGGAVAAPAFGDIMSFALPYLGIAPDQQG